MLPVATNPVSEKVLFITKKQCNIEQLYFYNSLNAPATDVILMTRPCPRIMASKCALVMRTCPSQFTFITRWYSSIGQRSMTMPDPIPALLLVVVVKNKKKINFIHIYIPNTSK